VRPQRSSATRSPSHYRSPSLTLPPPQVKGEASAMEREEVQKCKETMLNLSRFVKYKASAPK
jgi:hypothetical protein